MEELRTRLSNPRDFEELTGLLNDNHIIKLGNTVLQQYNIRDINVRYLLSAWVISNFPDTVLGQDKENKLNATILNISQSLVNSKSHTFKELLRVYHNIFQQWLKEDHKSLSENIFSQYHQLTVDIMNAPESCVSTLKECQNTLLDTAVIIGGDDFKNHILSYKPVVLDLEKLGEQYTKAFWDIFAEKYNNQDYSMLLLILGDISKLLIAICPQKQLQIDELIDLVFIKQRIENNAYSNMELIQLCVSILDIVKSLQSSQRDKELHELRDNIKKGNLYFPDIIKGLVNLVQNIVNDLKELRDTLETMEN